MTDPDGNIDRAEHHLAQARLWIDRTENGVLMDPVRDHTGLALAYAAVALARLWPAPPDPGSTMDDSGKVYEYVEPRENRDSA